MSVQVTSPPPPVIAAEHDWRVQRVPLAEDPIDSAGVAVDPFINDPEGSAAVVELFEFILSSELYAVDPEASPSLTPRNDETPIPQPSVIPSSELQPSATSYAAPPTPPGEDLAAALQSSFQNYVYPAITQPYTPPSTPPRQATHQSFPSHVLPQFGTYSSPAPMHAPNSRWLPDTPLQRLPEAAYPTPVPSPEPKVASKKRAFAAPSDDDDDAVTTSDFISHLPNSVIMDKLFTPRPLVPIQCQWGVCGKYLLPTRGGIQEHLRTVHGLKCDEKRVACQWLGCGQVLQSRSLPQHLGAQTHVGSLSGACRLCAAPIARDAIVRRHLAGGCKVLNDRNARVVAFLTLGVPLPEPGATAPPAKKRRTVSKLIDPSAWVSGPPPSLVFYP
ncbi:hypothetical protein FA95DRAFT_1606066 [Auriscalpium vulgare]|uniref:Uncharacterized protein n=1 Tax=Auriscalpium vulgare TaxID=40419 RepID=A0ACB8RTH4_9AGAM|nr:hypothetical protein FA95DRAFT_1606066 [Auriscalpium vulgare]